MTMTRELATECIKHAIVQLEERDTDLAKADVREETISHRLAVYIEQLITTKPGFTDVAVDVEYNRHRHLDKELNDMTEQCAEHNPNKTERVQPDIVVHLRTGKDEEVEHNYLVVEVKRHRLPVAPYSWVLCKLHHFTKKDGQFGYDVGVCLCFDVSDKGFSNWTQVTIAHQQPILLEGSEANASLASAIISFSEAHPIEVDP